MVLERGGLYLPADMKRKTRSHESGLWLPVDMKWKARSQKRGVFLVAGAVTCKRKDKFTIIYIIINILVGRILLYLGTA